MAGSLLVRIGRRNLAGRGAYAALLLAVSPGLCACASYVQRTERAFAAFRAGDFAGSAESFSDVGRTRSEFLSGVEAGTALMAAGDWAGARAQFERALRATEDIEGRALVGSEALGEALSTWALNDTTQAYQGEGFERVYVHAALALTYLAEGLLDDVFVEARRADQLLRAEEQLYDASYRAGGWGHLISALAYELLGEWDDAYIEYERMVEKDCGSELAGPALLRLASWLGRPEELTGWRERFPDAPAEDEPGRASVVLLAGVGLAPYKVEASIVVPTRKGLLKFAGPGYRVRPQSVRSLRLEAGDVHADSTVVEDVAAVAQANLEDRLAWIAGRSAVRAFAKRALTDRLEDNYGGGGRLAGDLFTLFSERADLRSWTTLPDTWQAARIDVPAGVHPLRLSAVGGETLELGGFELEPGETMFVIGRTVGARLFAHTIGGRPVVPEEPLTLEAGP